MLRSAQVLHGYGIRATDGMIGHVKDIYFDEKKWSDIGYVGACSSMRMLGPFDTWLWIAAAWSARVSSHGNGSKL
jgi:hypothetical protein